MFPTLNVKGKVMLKHFMSGLVVIFCAMLAVQVPAYAQQDSIAKDAVVVARRLGLSQMTIKITQAEVDGQMRRFENKIFFPHAFRNAFELVISNDNYDKGPFAAAFAQTQDVDQAYSLLLRMLNMDSTEVSLSSKSDVDGLYLDRHWTFTLTVPLLSPKTFYIFIDRLARDPAILVEYP